jgi:predicted amidophosphoribosyltransferase
MPEQETTPAMGICWGCLTRLLDTRECPNCRSGSSRSYSSLLQEITKAADDIRRDPRIKQVEEALFNVG